MATRVKIFYCPITYVQRSLRLGDYVHRGVVLPEGYTLLDMYRERAALYEKYADITVEGSDDISYTLEELLEKLK